MRRRDASDWYFLGRALFDRLVQRLPGHLAFFHAVSGGRVVSTELVLVSARRLYAFLGGTLSEAFNLGPNYLLKHRVVTWGIEHGKRQYVLGGSHERGDGLLRYKGGFAPSREAPFRLARLVHDERAYRELCDVRADAVRRDGGHWTPRAGFFPAYHA
ncbi:MAG: GNAT family N-acetyltransferase [Anaeromyxobacter sp.]